ncbi:hypothetical protein A2242_02905 [Candidatus Falkowbacteria bacterium RIFOXYA2_FULL_47_9]|uniref:Bacterial type II secretion system protein E domain-containing protein n=1 Tax=Candidatus Falkowbacteria bacterium RIFOXYA2_FULL_47_9 TaxID=1797995 RepID=A0A1F5SJS7_9BACT|nr:MAG: hypothetical protein A2242_02905 [Candidatus Falkowbacteria bacterium RIFOXYA2_FULL_47_9]
MFSPAIQNTTAAAELDAFIRKLLAQAFYDNVLEIHLIPNRYDTQICRNVDGVLSPAFFLPKKFHEPAIEYFKKEERLVLAIPESRIVCRVSFLPTEYGEEAVLKLAEANPAVRELSELNFSADESARLQKQLNQGGMMIITGPAGSGKTTTLYSLLATLNEHTRNVCLLSEMSVPEPTLAGVNHSYFNSSKGYGPAAGLRAILRQIPDVIAIDELADRETADIALQAALKKLPVLATLPSENFTAARKQLADWGFSNATITSAVRTNI